MIFRSKRCARSHGKNQLCFMRWESWRKCELNRTRKQNNYV